MSLEETPVKRMSLDNKSVEVMSLEETPVKRISLANKSVEVMSLDHTPVKAMSISPDLTPAKIETVKQTVKLTPVM